MESIETIMSVNGRFRAEIYVDDCPLDPRKDGDHLGIIVTGRRSAPFLGEEICDGEWAPTAGAVVLPIFILEHSGVWVSTQSFHQPWDSWEGAAIYTTPERMREYGFDPAKPEAVRRALRHEVEEFNCYLQGDVYGYAIFREEEDEEIASCWGYFGIEHIRADIQNILEQYEETTPLQGTLPGVRVA